MESLVYLFDGRECTSKIISHEYHNRLTNENRKKLVKALEEAIKLEHPDLRVLEISPLSGNPLGVKLNYTSLKDIKGNYVESVYQASKVFKNGTQLEDLYSVDDARKAKFDLRKYSLGDISHFNVYGNIINTNSKLVIFNWLWCKAVYQQKDLHNELIKYNIFTDFYSKIHRSEQGNSAEAASLYVALYHNGILEESLNDISVFAKYVYGIDL